MPGGLKVQEETGEWDWTIYIDLYKNQVGICALLPLLSEAL